MVIVEGPDGSGKSTLISKLGYERRRLRALRAGRGADGANKEGWGNNLPALQAYDQQIQSALAEEQFNPPGSDAYGTRIAFDRFHLSEVVYGPMLRGHQEIDLETLVALNHVIRMAQVPVILCLPPLERTIENVYQEDRHVPSYQTRQFLVDAYHAFERLTPWATIVYDFTRDPLPAVSVNAG